MLKKMLLGAALLSLLACNNANENTAATPEGDVDAARMFVRAALDGNYKAAQNLIVPDSANKEWLAVAERSYLQNDVTRQRGLRESSINIHDTKRLNDSVTVVSYSNTLFNDRNENVKVVRQAGVWLVDLKYTFQTADTTASQPVRQSTPPNSNPTPQTNANPDPDSIRK